MKKKDQNKQEGDDQNKYRKVKEEKKGLSSIINILRNSPDNIICINHEQAAMEKKKINKKKTTIKETRKNSWEITKSG